jgi:hypothetical protein
MSGPELIRLYILSVKGVDIGGIAEPQTVRQWELYRRALSVAMFWYAPR